MGAMVAPWAVWAQEAAPGSTPDTPNERVLVLRHYDNAVGSSDAASEGAIRADLLKSRPALRPAEVLEFVPGVVVTQHSGDGKANQYFLRGFNLDHGTDFATRVNGMPVNMPSHAHGQGYTDLNFLIPELVQRIQYRKGPYFAMSSDFALAGAADIAYRDSLDQDLLDLSVGQRGYKRLLWTGSAAVGSGLQALYALETMNNDGPWTVPEGLHRRNAVFSLSSTSPQESWQASAMSYRAQWTATDQIPQRLLGVGGFGLFDSLDPSSGGVTARDSLSWQWQRQVLPSSSDDAQPGWWKASAYLIRYGLNLYSNFTYALLNPQQGDQFKQSDDRVVKGGEISRSAVHRWGGWETRSEWGLQWRQDQTRVGLFDSVQRRVTDTVRDDRIGLSMLGLYAQSGIEWQAWLRTILGLRADHLDARVDSLKLVGNSGHASAQQLSPKMSVILGPFNEVPALRGSEFFINAGRGFHSNDARGATITQDPRTGEVAQRLPLLAAGQGWELGARTQAIAGLQSSLALWALRVQSELIYAGDEGTTQASQASARRGVEFNNRYAATRWLFVRFDLP